MYSLDVLYTGGICMLELIVKLIKDYFSGIYIALNKVKNE